MNEAKKGLISETGKSPQYGSTRRKTKIVETKLYNQAKIQQRMESIYKARSTEM